MSEKIKRKPFLSRLFGSVVVLMIIALALVLIGFFVWILPERDGFQLLGKDLPPRSALSSTEGKFVDFGYYVSGRRQFLKPKIEFKIDGKTFQFQTIAGYATNVFPFQQMDKPEILFVSANPENAWLKWEYEKLFSEFHGLSLGKIGESIKTKFNYLAVGILGLSGLFLFVNLFFPLLRRFL